MTSFPLCLVLLAYIITCFWALKIMLTRYRIRTYGNLFVILIRAIGGPLALFFLLFDTEI